MTVIHNNDHVYSVLTFVELELTLCMDFSVVHTPCPVLAVPLVFVTLPHLHTSLWSNEMLLLVWCSCTMLAVRSDSGRFIPFYFGGILFCMNIFFRWFEVSFSLFRNLFNVIKLEGKKQDSFAIFSCILKDVILKYFFS